MRRLGIAALAVLAACGGASLDPGRVAQLQIGGEAEFVRAAAPPDQHGPQVASATTAHATVQPGSRGERLQVALAPGATGAAIGLRGDVGYWLVPAGLPDVQVPDLPTVDVRLDFAAGLPLGALALEVRAVDATGRFGAATIVPLTSELPPPPDGALVVSLSWDSEADLDLHVVDPHGVEVWSGNINSYEPPPPGSSPADPNAWRAGGLLDLDSNASCVIDGRRREDVIWAVAAPPGRYVVRVDTPSLCGTPAARWHVEARAAGVSLGVAEGTSLPTDTRGEHGAGAGWTALQLDVPGASP